MVRDVLFGCVRVVLGVIFGIFSIVYILLMLKNVIGRLESFC